MRKVLFYLAAGLASLFICLICLEIITRVTYTIKKDYQIEMCRYAAYIKTDAGSTMSHVHRPAVDVKLMGVPVKTNSHGFRDNEYNPEKASDTFRILMLGDSLTFGWGVRAENRFSDLLEKYLNQELGPEGRYAKIEIINTGIGNYNTSQEVSLLKRIYSQWKPDTVMINYFINDAEETPRKGISTVIKYSYLAMWFWGRLDTLSRMWGASDSFETYYKELYDDDQPGWKAAQAALNELVKITNENGIKPILTILPELHSVYPDYLFGTVHQKVRAAAQKAGIEYIVDLTPRFSGEDPPGLWVSPDDAHPNDHAHKIIFSGIKDYLLKEGLVSEWTGKKSDSGAS